MGCCSSTPEQVQSNDINEELLSAKQHAQQSKRLLLLGSNGSGKSTFFKQFCRIYDNSYIDQNRINFKKYIYYQMLDQMKLLIDTFNEIEEEYEDDYPDDIDNEFTHLQLTENGKKAAANVKEIYNIGFTWNQSDIKDFEILWKEPAIKEIYENRAVANLSLYNSTSYFFNQIKRITSKTYIPTDNDILLNRYTTSGVIEEHFIINNVCWYINDINRQRTECRKWLHSFEYIDGILFVVDLSSYCQIFIEDESMMVMQESLWYFQEIWDYYYVRNPRIILLLNKEDLFALKIQNIPLTVCFPEYVGSNDFDECVDYIKEQFKKISRRYQRNKKMYIHVTCATDKYDVQTVFGYIQHNIGFVERK